MNRIIPPVFVFAIAIAAIYGVNDLIDFGKTDSFRLLRYLLAMICFIGAGIFGIFALWAFKKASTTVNPVDVSKASTVVSGGVFRFSRNPMYLGLVLLLLCYSLYIGNIWGVFISWLFVLYMNRFQILPEEQAMTRKFGQDYLEYKSRVRRWI
ncbi:methyltransferase family protein [Vibrio salinus]|uniref:methyltransferase family protein n=1 Tax=Vibrio salinus TaxID=2899784 RepID=UPI001E47D246|nr:isoprenylcysteine carboxylmethyltransferase family protein [Vibrio salinus]MCE0492667.1 isoprenylcysteine carboxylmethyltransferase family protein [Vibrio salinus]